MGLAFLMHHPSTLSANPWHFMCNKRGGLGEGTALPGLSFPNILHEYALAAMNTLSNAVSIPAGTLVVLCGVAGCGKSTFARRHFAPTQIVASDECRAMLSDDPENQQVSTRAFQLLHWLVTERLMLGRATIVDSTALSRRARGDLLHIARVCNAPKWLICFNMSVDTCLRQDAMRERNVGAEVISRQYQLLRQALADIGSEGWDNIIMLTEDNVDRLRFFAQMGTFDLRHITGPFDIIGDVHGCTDELLELAGRLGYVQEAGQTLRHPQGRTLVFLGDMADRGPHNAYSFELAMSTVEAGAALYTPGNHCNKLMRYLQGRKVQQTHGLALTVQQVEERELQVPGFKERLRRFIETAPTYLWLDGGRLVVAHAGIKEHMIGRDNDRIRTMCLYGDITGEVNPDGTPVRRDWAQHYRGKAAVVYGHTPRPEPVWVNNTINIDQGCVFGGWLTALRWPERHTVQVPARRAYYTVRTPDFLIARVAKLTS